MLNNGVKAVSPCFALVTETLGDPPALGVLVIESHWPRCCKLPWSYSCSLTDAPAQGASQTCQCDNCRAIWSRGACFQGLQCVCVCPDAPWWWVCVSSISRFAYGRVEWGNHLVDDAQISHILTLDTTPLSVPDCQPCAARMVRCLVSTEGASWSAYMSVVLPTRCKSRRQLRLVPSAQAVTATRFGRHMACSEGVQGCGHTAQLKCGAVVGADIVPCPPALPVHL